MIGNLKRFALCLCVLLIAWTMFPAAAFADSSDEEKVRVGYYENEVFQEGAKDGAAKTGYAYEYYQKISEYTGWRYEYVYGEFSDLYQKFLDGEIDFLAGLAKRPEREAYIGYPDRAMGSENYNLIKHDDDDDITVDPKTLKGKKIGVLDSAMTDVLNQFLEDKNVDAEVVIFNDYEPLFSAFDNHEIDIMAAEGDGAYGRAHAELLYSFGSSEYYLCVNKSRKDLLADLNMAQTELAVDEPNYINSLRSKYYPETFSSKAFSPEEKEWLNDHSELHIGYLENYLPYSDTDSNGEATGLVKDIIPRMLNDLDIDNLNVTFTGYTKYDDMISDLGSGRIDAAFPVGGGLYYSEVSGLFQSTPVVSAATELVHKGEYSEDTVATFAVNENNRMQYYFVTTYYPDAEITLYPSIDECLKAVSEGEAGCTTLNGLRANDILRNSRYSGLSMLQTTHDDDRCFGVQIGNAGLLKLINRGINVLGSDYAQNLAFRYTDQLYSISFTDFIKNNIILFVGILTAIALLIILLLMRDSRRSRQQIQEKEKRLTLQDELIEQQAQKEQQDKMITALASDYRCVYHVDLDKNDAVCYREDSNDNEQTAEGIHFPYLERFKWYAEHSVAESYREGFLKFIEPANVRAGLEKEPIITYRYLAQRAGKE